MRARQSFLLRQRERKSKNEQNPPTERGWKFCLKKFLPSRKIFCLKVGLFGQEELQQGKSTQEEEKRVFAAKKNMSSFVGRRRNFNKIAFFALFNTTTAARRTTTTTRKRLFEGGGGMSSSRLLSSSLSSSSSSLSSMRMRTTMMMMMMLKNNIDRMVSSSSASSSSSSSSDKSDDDSKTTKMKEEFERQREMQGKMRREMIEIAIDRTGLYETVQQQNAKGSLNNNDKKNERKKNEGLLGHIESLIKFRGGPITVHEFMSEALTNPTYGYYTKTSSKDKVFGKSGDFTTSPEISQIFGELLGVWCATIWEQLGKPEELHLIEFGPGRGTLMMDLLRGTSNFKKFSEALRVHLIEISPALRKKQFETLKCQGSLETFESLNNPLLAEIKPNPFAAKKTDDDDDDDDDSEEEDEKFSTKGNVSGITAHGTKVYWHNSLDEVPSGPTCIIAHEFFDALPVHQFRRTERGWVEKLVAMNEENNSLEFVLSPGATLSSSQLVKRRLRKTSSSSSSSSSSSDVNSSSDSDMNNETIVSLEVSPKSIVHWEKMMDRINDEGKNGGRGGAAIAIDYGDEGPLADTLEAIKDHKFVENLLESPGECDLSAHVDFGALRGVVEERNEENTSEVKCFGPTTQQKLLLELGIVQRLQKLAETCSEEQLEVLADGCQRLVGDDKVEEGETPGMGLRYKALCMVSKNLQRPAGFSDA